MVGARLRQTYSLAVPFLASKLARGATTLLILCAGELGSPEFMWVLARGLKAP